MINSNATQILSKQSKHQTPISSSRQNQRARHTLT